MILVDKNCDKEKLAGVREVMKDWKKGNEIIKWKSKYRNCLLVALCGLLFCSGCGNSKGDNNEFVSTQTMEVQETLDENSQEEMLNPLESEPIEVTSTMKISDFCINFVERPTGVDTQNIYLSWVTNENQSAYEIIVKQKDLIVWESGKQMSNQTFNILCEGIELEDFQEYQVEVSCYDEKDLPSKESTFFTTSYVEENSVPLENAEFITASEKNAFSSDGLPVFGNVYAISKEVNKAYFVGTSYGVYDAYINGKRIGNDEWKPGWTDYRDTLLYNVYDVTSLIQEGENQLAIVVGNGWWAGKNAFGTYGDPTPTVAAVLRVEYEDGLVDEFVTDDTWQYTKETGIRFADFYEGETYDFSMKNITYFSENHWEGLPVEVTQKSDVLLKSFYGYQVKERGNLTQAPIAGYVYEGVDATETTYGSVHKVMEWENAEQLDKTMQVEGIHLDSNQVLLVDLGQNIAGIPYIKYETGDEETNVEILFAEMLNDTGEKSAGNDGPAGSLYRANYRAADTLVKIKSIEANEYTYKPSFFFTGFRYLTVKADQPIDIKSLKGICVGNTSPEISSLEIDYDKVNKLYQNVVWSQRNNYTLIATDCPQRDERLGWLGDLNSFSRTSMYNQNLFSFYEKWQQDAVDAQTAKGAFTDTAPTTINTGAGNAGWAEAGIIVSLNVYRMYGNLEQLQFMYPAMTAYMDYLERKSDFSGASGIGAGLAYGDWLAKENTDKAFLAALWYALDAQDMQNIATILDLSEDVAKYQALWERILEYLQTNYIACLETNDRSQVSLTQTELCFLLHYNMLKESQREVALQALKYSVEKNNYKLMTGFAGTPILLQTLTENGLVDDAYKVLLCEENPSWLYSVNQGATTIWERYDSYTKEKGFADAAMNSFDHFNEGSVAQWMYEAMLGVTVDLSENRPIKIAPKIPSDEIPIKHVKGSIHTVYGEVTVEWTVKADQVCMDICVPFNVETYLELPMEGEKAKQISGGNYHYEGTLALQK